eukprot:7990886-Heterocapsa_arctica.AAC.2
MKVDTEGSEEDQPGRSLGKPHARKSCRAKNPQVALRHVRSLREKAHGAGRGLPGATNARDLQILQDAARSAHQIPAQLGADGGKKRGQIRSRGGTSGCRANPTASQGGGMSPSRNPAGSGANGSAATSRQRSQGSR